MKPGDFPGGPMVESLPTNAGDAGSIPYGGTKTPQAKWYGKKSTNKQTKTIVHILI